MGVEFAENEYWKSNGHGHGGVVLYTTGGSPITALGGAATIADGADVAEGAVADAIVAAGATGTLSAKLRRVTQGLEDLKTLLALAAGENHIGQVGGHTAQIDGGPVVSTSLAYTAGDCVGGKLTLANAVRGSGGTGVLQSLLLIDASNQKAALELLIFNADPSATTFTDNGAVSINSADVSKIIRRLSIAAADYVTIDSKAFADITLGGRVIKAASGTSLYAALVAVGTPTYAATTALTLRLGILQD